jgi:hypothetical protein
VDVDNRGHGVFISSRTVFKCPQAKSLSSGTLAGKAHCSMIREWRKIDANSSRDSFAPAHERMISHGR